MGDYPLGRATVYDDLSGSPAWMHEVLNAGHIGLWTIILAPTTGVGQMLANAVKALLRAGTENLAVELEGKGQELRRLLSRPESGNGGQTS